MNDDDQNINVIDYSDLENEVTEDTDLVREDEDASEDVLDIDDAYEQVHGSKPKLDRDEY